MITKHNILDLFMNDQISLDGSYTQQELFALATFDMLGKTAELNLLCGYGSDADKDEQINERSNQCKSIYPNAKKIELHGTLENSIGEIFWVFKLTYDDKNEYFCQNRRILYCEDEKKYYRHKPYYHGNFYIFVDLDDNDVYMMNCNYNSNFKYIVSPNIINDMRPKYQFENKEIFEKAWKLFNSNINLARRIYEKHSI